ncbi:MAG: alkaline phosphatase family protein [Pseudomonadota bacterium]
MIISIVNLTETISDAELQKVIRAINRQIAEDFEPYWSFGAKLRLEGTAGKIPDKESPSELRGDAILYLWNQTDVEDALGYHDINARGIPYGFVFTDLSKQLGENWTVTFSHEALELVGDSQNNLLAQGPHPAHPGREVFHWFEMCDAVQSQTYKIDDIEVSNFVLPLYFTPGEQEGGRNDFLGIIDKQKNALTSFGVAVGGYVGFYDPVTRQHEQYAAPDDKVAAKRLKIKAKVHSGRGFARKNTVAVGDREDAHMQALNGALRASGSAASPGDPIKHVVVLMMENRSFDHMLGGMSKFDPDVDGVRQDGKSYFNVAPDGTDYFQQPGAQDVILKQRDLDHEHDGTMGEIGSTASPMSGFVARFIKRYPDATPAELQQVMAYFDFGDDPSGDTLPALHTLARHFAVCDHWFSSMPGPTWPNRFFVHSATCLGHVLMPSREAPQNMRLYYQETIFDRLSDAGVKWTIYHDGIPQSIVMTNLLTRYLTWRGYAKMDAFYEQAAGPAASFPEYAFIEPGYFGAEENDQHPPADVRKGETLIANVYNALRSNTDLWNSTLLVIVYDEHGGFYDHVTPPATVAPDNHTTEYAFDELGVRVPAILVSPWVKRGVVKTVFDHTSLLRYLCDKWNLPPLGARMQPSAGSQQARSIAEAISPTLRTDTPASIDLPVIKARKAKTANAEPSISGSRESLLMFVEQLAQTNPELAGQDEAKRMSGKRMTKKQAATQKTKRASNAQRIDDALAALERLRT